MNIIIRQQRFCEIEEKLSHVREEMDRTRQEPDILRHEFEDLQVYLDKNQASCRFYTFIAGGLLDI